MHLPGTYIIDPSLESNTGSYGKKKKKSKNGSGSQLNASFSSRKGECRLNLGTSCEDGVPRRAHVEVFSQTHVTVNLVSEPLVIFAYFGFLT
jgi:hypothetical protein